MAEKLEDIAARVSGEGFPTTAFRSATDDEEVGILVGELAEDDGETYIGFMVFDGFGHHAAEPLTLDVAEKLCDHVLNLIRDIRERNNSNE